MVEHLLVQRKLVKLRQYLEELKGISKYSFQDYQGNYLIKRTAERLIQLLVDVASDINSHVLVDEGFPPPPDFYRSFIESAKTGLIPHEFALRIAPSAGERNIIVHEYENIEDLIVYQSISEAIQVYEQYFGYVTEFLQRHT